MRERSQRFDPRQVMRSETFEVFHYREPRAKAVEVHHHDFYEVYYLLDGAVDYWVDGRIIRLEPGDLLLIGPEELHRPILEENQRYERIVIWIDRGWLEGLFEAPVRLSGCFAGERNRHIRPGSGERSALTARMGELVREFYGRDYGSAQCAFGIFLQLMVQINRMGLRSREDGNESREMSELVRKVLNHIHAHLTEPLSLEGIAGEFFVSKYYLSHAFSGEVGVSVYRYILLRRLLMARQLLAGGESAKQVCRSCGFSDYTSFYRAFRSEYGISPGQYASERA